MTTSRTRAIELVGEHCDLEERLEWVPPSARVRGLWFDVVEREMEERGLLPEFGRIFGREESQSFRFYWAGEYLMRLAVAGALAARPSAVHEGMFETARHHASTFSRSLLGRTLLRLLSTDPVRITQQGIAARRQTMSYGRWVLTRSAPGELEVHVDGEYMWIESHVAGAWKGTLETIGIEADVRAQLRGRFDGVLYATWPKRAASQKR